MSSRQSALLRLKGLRSATARPGGAGGCSAAASHVLNDEYMERFKACLSVSGAPGKDVQAEVGSRVEVHASATGSSPASPAYTHQGGQQQQQLSGSWRPLVAPAATDSSIAEPPASSWCTGPCSPAGTVIQLAGRNILCASIDWQRGEAVFGSADHALYTVDLRQRKKGRTLYTKRYGHTEWATAVQHLPGGGGIVSGGMDSKLCLWDAGRAVCRDLRGHSGSISQIELVHTGGSSEGGSGSGGHFGSSRSSGSAGPTLFLSASYDKSLLLWEAPSGRQLQRLAAHTAPVLQLCTALGGAAASGDRSGGLVAWDLAAGKAGRSMPKSHQGQVSALAWWSPAGNGVDSQQLLLSGGQDGLLQAWDCRAREPCAAVAAHAGGGGRGAVSGIVAVAGESLVATAGADGSVRAFDLRRGLQQAWQVQLQDFPYSLAGTGSGLVLAGTGDGSLSVIEGSGGTVLYALRANTAAVRMLHAGARQLVVGGDDGSCTIYDFS